MLHLSGLRKDNSFYGLTAITCDINMINVQWFLFFHFKYLIEQIWWKVYLIIWSSIYYTNIGRVTYSSRALEAVFSRVLINMSITLSKFLIRHYIHCFFIKGAEASSRYRYQILNVLPCPLSWWLLPMYWSQCYIFDHVMNLVYGTITCEIGNMHFSSIFFVILYLIQRAGKYNF